MMISQEVQKAHSNAISDITGFSNNHFYDFVHNFSSKKHILLKISTNFAAYEERQKSQKWNDYYLGSILSMTFDVSNVMTAHA